MVGKKIDRKVFKISRLLSIEESEKFDVKKYLSKAVVISCIPVT